MNNKNTINIITGQTATGKTTYALSFAGKGDQEIVSADSRQAYQYLDIISGKDLSSNKFHLIKTLKPNLQIGYYQEKRCRIWLYDVLNPHQYFSAYDWVRSFQAVIEILKIQKKVPVVVGGSYFYLHSWLYGLPDQGINPDWKLRKELGKLSVTDLQFKLQSLDKKIYRSLNESDQKNKRRLTRWIEKVISQKSPLRQGFEGQAKVKSQKDEIKQKKIRNYFKYNLIGLKHRDKEKLKEAITQRVEQRIKQGAIEEAELLLRMGYTLEDPGLKTIGYQQIFKYLQDQYNLHEAKQEWIKKELQYAKRQWTLMKKNPEINWHIIS